MPRNIYHQMLCKTVAALLFTLMVTLTGCATMGVDADGDESFSPDWSNAFRQRSELSGFSTTSRQIERRLGIE